MARVLALIWVRGTNIFRKSEIKDSTASVNKPPDGQITRPSRSILQAWKFQAFFSLCKAAPSGNRTFLDLPIASNNVRCPSQSRHYFRMTGLQLLDPDSDIGGRTSKNKAASTKTSGYPLRLSPEGAMLACRGANNGKQDEGTGPYSGHAPDVPRENAQAPAEASRASTEREGCRFQGRRSRGLLQEAR